MREIFIERNNSLLRIAIKDNGVLNECFVEEDSKNQRLEKYIKEELKI